MDYFSDYFLPVILRQSHLIFRNIQNDFRLVSFIAAGFTVATFVLLFFIPESPVYLVTKNKLVSARKTLGRIRDLSKTVNDTIK